MTKKKQHADKFHATRCRECATPNQGNRNQHGGRNHIDTDDLILESGRTGKEYAVEDDVIDMLDVGKYNSDKNETGNDYKNCSMLCTRKNPSYVFKFSVPQYIPNQSNIHRSQHTNNS